MIRFYKLIIVTIVAALISLFASAANASDTLIIANPATVKFVVHDDKVYFRNLNQYDATWLPCCYNYYLDLTTDGGRAAFSTFLSCRLAGQKIMFYKTAWTTSGRIEIIGDF